MLFTAFHHGDCECPRLVWCASSVKEPYLRKGKADCCAFSCVDIQYGHSICETNTHPYLPTAPGTGEHRSY